MEKSMKRSHWYRKFMNFASRWFGIERMRLRTISWLKTLGPEGRNAIGVELSSVLWPGGYRIEHNHYCHWSLTWALSICLNLSHAYNEWPWLTESTHASEPSLSVDIYHAECTTLISCQHPRNLTSHCPPLSAVLCQTFTFILLTFIPFFSSQQDCAQTS